MTNIPNGKKITLDNGLRIVTEEIPTLRSVAMGILIGAGSGNETEKESGISPKGNPAPVYTRPEDCRPHFQF